MSDEISKLVQRLKNEMIHIKMNGDPYNLLPILRKLFSVFIEMDALSRGCCSRSTLLHSDMLKFITKSLLRAVGDLLTLRCRLAGYDDSDDGDTRYEFDSESSIDEWEFSERITEPDENEDIEMQEGSTEDEDEDIESEEGSWEDEDEDMESEEGPWEDEARRKVESLMFEIRDCWVTSKDELARLEHTKASARYAMPKVYDFVTAWLGSTHESKDHKTPLQRKRKRGSDTETSDAETSDAETSGAETFSASKHTIDPDELEALKEEETEATLRAVEAHGTPIEEGRADGASLAVEKEELEGILLETSEAIQVYGYITEEGHMKGASLATAFKGAAEIYLRLVLMLYPDGRLVFRCEKH